MVSTGASYAVKRYDSSDLLIRRQSHWQARV